MCHLTGSRADLVRHDDYMPESPWIPKIPLPCDVRFSSDSAAANGLEHTGSALAVNPAFTCSYAQNRRSETQRIPCKYSSSFPRFGVSCATRRDRSGIG